MELILGDPIRSGMADLYVYFYQQGLRLLRPGGRMGYVVTNKWLKAGYAERMRGVFADEDWLYRGAGVDFTQESGVAVPASAVVFILE
jgi:predicted methyltransferase